MSQPIKVPKEVMELVYEQVACNELAQSSGFFRALAYKQKVYKLEALIWRTMTRVFPQTTEGDWVIDWKTGMATDTTVVPPVAKKTRKPRAPKPAAADPANSLGE
jgi:hypothetical protein